MTPESKEKNRIRRRAFWKQTLSYFDAKGFKLFDGRPPTKDYTLKARTSIKECFYKLAFGKNEIRVEFIMDRPIKRENKCIYRYFCKYRKEIESRIDYQLEWELGENKVPSRMYYSKSLKGKIDGHDEKNWFDMIDWLYIHIKSMESAFCDIIPKVKKRILMKKIFSIFGFIVLPICILLFYFFSDAFASEITNLDGESHIVTITQDGIRSDYTIDSGSSVTVCESGCFILFPSGTMLPLSGDESLDIEGGDVVVK